MTIMIMFDILAFGFLPDLIEHDLKSEAIYRCKMQRAKFVRLGA
jgi:hypothetical protein